MKSPLALAATLLLLTSCGARSMTGALNGVTYRVENERDAVPGGVPHSFELRQGAEGAIALWVDGLSFGDVARGQHVEVDGDGRVTVDGEPRVGVEAAGR